jgi:hypothetical protein
MASYSGTTIDTNLLNFKNPFLSTNAGKLGNHKIRLLVDDPTALDPDAPSVQGFTYVDHKQPIVPEELGGQVDDQSTLAADWFERFHVTPKIFTFGNVLTTQLEDTEVFSAFRRDAHDWLTYVNNAGDGVTLVGQPTLPDTIQPLEGIQMQLRIDVIGEPSVDTTLDFGFDTETIYVPITLDRIVLYTPLPEMPYDEELEFLTDIITLKDGTEQRISVRKNPRQFFNWNHVLEDGTERQRLSNILFEWQTRTYGIPIWHDMVRLSVDTASGSTSLNVTNTDYCDFRDDELIVIYQDDIVFDVLTASAIASTTITLDNPTTNAYNKDTIVAPLRIAEIVGKVGGGRYPTMNATMNLRFRVKDNDVDLADTSAFSTYDDGSGDRVLFDDDNGLIGQMKEEFIQDTFILDNQTGVIYQNSSWPHNKRLSNKTFLCFGRQAAWNARQVIHALRGQQVSFFLPTFSQDLTLDTDITSGQDIINIVHTNYNQFVAQRTSRNIARIIFKDGSTPIIKEVLSSSVVSSTREALTMDSNFTSDIDKDDVLRIDFLELVRFASDKIVFTHEKGDRLVRISTPVMVVFD